MDSKTSNAAAPNSQTSAQVDNNVNQAQHSVPQDTPNLGAIRKSGQQEVLQALSKVTGQEFGKTKDVIKFVESLTKNTGGNDKAKGSKSSGNGEIAELRNMIQGLQSQLEQKDQAVRRTTLQSQIKETAVKAGFDPNMLDIATPLFEQQLDFDEGGNFYVKGANGAPRLDKSGNPLGLDALAQDILRQRPKLAVDDARSGTGSRFGQGVGRNENDIPDASQDLEAWKKWKESQGIGGRSLKGMNVSFNKPIV
jgi:hypothetical protein